MKVVSLQQRNNTGLLINCSTIITYLKHLQKDKISCVKNSFLAICKPLSENATQKFKIKKEIYLVWLWNYKFKLPCKLVDLFITNQSS